MSATRTSTVPRAGTLVLALALAAGTAGCGEDDGVHAFSRRFYAALNAS